MKTKKEKIIESNKPSKYLRLLDANRMNIAIESDSTTYDKLTDITEHKITCRSFLLPTPPFMLRHLGEDIEIDSFGIVKEKDNYLITVIFFDCDRDMFDREYFYENPEH